MQEMEVLEHRARDLEAQLVTLLRARVRRLEREVSVLKMQLGADAPDMEAARLSPRESEVVRLLLAQEERSTAEELARGVFGEQARVSAKNGRHDDRQTVRTVVDRAKRKLLAVGWTITSRPYSGYRLERVA